MRLIFHILIAILLCSFLSCNNNNKVLQNAPTDFIMKISEQQSVALHFLDSIHCMNYYTESKWKIYLKYCDKKIVIDESGKQLKSPAYLGECDLYLRLAHIENDTLLGLLFEPVLSDSILVNNSCFEDSSVILAFFDSHWYDIKDKQFYGYGSENGMYVDSTRLNDYCNGIPNCNKKDFIEANKEILNKWFIDEAIKRGFIR